VSLAAALALPFTMASGDAFPSRDLILFVSFNIILITVVGFGLGLPVVVKLLGMSKVGREEYIAEHEAELNARREALAKALASLDAMTDDRELSAEVVKLLRARHEIRSNQLPEELDPEADVSAVGIDLVRELIKTERKFIHTQLREGKITDESRRRIERDLDLEEAGLINREFRRIPL
jgi:CPA1 family monovalent cation:H+ antiporter